MMHSCKASCGYVSYAQGHTSL